MVSISVLRSLREIAWGFSLAALLALPAFATPPPCIGDCDGGGTVTVDELVRGVNIALGILPIGNCPQFDRDASLTVSVDEIIVAVQNALNGCASGPTPTITGGPITPAPTATATAAPTTPLLVRGKVLQAGAAGGSVSAAAGATITASVDRNGDGQIGAGESVTRTADFEGEYVINLNVSPGDRVVLGFRTDDSAPLFRTYDAAGGDVVVNVTLRTAEELDCNAARCALQGDRLTITDLPPGVSGMAQLFNPVTQADAFPGDFADNDGNILLSGVFASIELTGAGGQPLEQLPAPATLRMQIPRETWPIVADITPANGRIDVPLYAFDEAAGVWVRDGAAVLEGDDGAILPESALAGIRNGTFSGGVIAAGQVEHFSFWNVDWPIETHGCVSGRILDENGSPAAGAALRIRGVTYVGTSTATSDGSGTFCADVLRSESTGEDVDQDGIPGETQRVSVRATYQGRVYDLGEIPIPVAPATCTVGCAALGDVRLTPDRELQPRLCTLTVIVRDRDGVPLPGALALAADETIDPDVAEELCSQTPEGFCLSSGITDDSGMASLTAPLLDSLFIIGLSTMADGDTLLQRWGEVTSSGCPQQPVDITLTDGYRQVLLTVTLEGTSISWTPTTYGVTGIGVVGLPATQKWLVVAPPPGFDPPVVYGSVPAGAQQIIPLDGAPAGLASGDFVSVFLTAPAEDGYTVIGQGFTFVP